MLGNQPIPSAIAGDYKVQAEGNSCLYGGNVVGAERQRQTGNKLHI